GTITDNDNPPINTVPAAQTVDEDTVLTFNGARLITVNDADGNLSTTQLTVLNGTLNVSLSGGATISAGANGSSTLTLSGTQAQINAALATLTYKGAQDYNGPDTLTVKSTDTGTNTDTDTITINVTPVNDAPVAVNDTFNISLADQSINGMLSKFYNYREGTDGPNLSNLSQVESFINTHNPNATFVSTVVNYQYGNGNLGYYASNDDNLKNWLSNDGNSLVRIGSPISSSDAMVHMEGLIELSAGTYNFRVLSDDGYSIRIDGVVVAEVNAIQPPTTTTHPTFTIANSGLHTIEIIYWDQGGEYVLRPELRKGSGDYQPWGWKMLVVMEL
ncbi:Ig-like domain-containing protein, partial [Legionella norrlandica]|uniref:Ig-like domain-containing protein n=1 Tax=Legionella norrlandica TaxID=1498499 RepID=UPI000559EA94